MVDREKCFLDVVVSFLGNMYGLRVLRNSLLYCWIINNEFFFGLVVRVGVREINFFLLGDSVYLFFLLL